MRLCISGSFRFYDEMIRLKDALLESGVDCDWPTPCPLRDPNDMTRDPHQTVEQARECVLNHFAKMDRSEAILVYDPKGYVGNSVIMEIGYAFARSKPIYATFPIDDKSLMSLVSKVIEPSQAAAFFRQSSKMTSRLTIKP